MSLPYPDPALPSNPNPYFTDNSFARGDQQRANNGFIWSNLEDLDTRVVALEDASIKTAIDYSKPLGEIFFLPDQKTTDFDFDLDNPRDYFPAICLSSIEGDQNYTVPDLPTAFLQYMRSVKIKYLSGQSGEVSAWSVTVSAAVVTFPNTTSANTVLAALVEDSAVDGTSLSCRRFLQLGTNIYQVASSGVSLVSRTVTLTTSPSEQGSQTAYWYAYKNTGDAGATSITIPGIVGEAIMAPNDANGYFVGNLRTRGFMQGHIHNSIDRTDGFGVNPNGKGASVSGLRYDSSGSETNKILTTGSPDSDGTNGTPLTRKITHGPAVSMIAYMWCGG